MSFVVILTTPHNVLVVLIGEATSGFEADCLSLPLCIQVACVASALAPLDENDVDCACRDQRRWCYRLSLLVVACRD